MHTKQDTGGKDTSSKESTTSNKNEKGEFGEGNYKASREFNDKEAEWVGKGKVEEAARNAAPRSADEERDMKDAEAKGRSHAKEEDPQLTRKAEKK